MKTPTSLSDLFLNFSEEDRREIFLDVAKKATERQLEMMEKYFMSEVIENQTEEIIPLEGQYEFQHNQQKIFHNLPIAASYITAFEIKHYQINDGHLANGEYVVQINYYRREE